MLKPKSVKDRQADCRTEILLGMCVESHLNKPLAFKEGLIRGKGSPERDLSHMYLWMMRSVYKWIYV